MLLKAGDYSGAAKRYKKVLKDYDDPNAHYWLSVTYAYMGEDGKACKEVRRYLKRAKSGRYAKAARTAKANCD